MCAHVMHGFKTPASGALIHGHVLIVYHTPQHQQVKTELISPVRASPLPIPHVTCFRCQSSTWDYKNKNSLDVRCLTLRLVVTLMGTQVCFWQPLIAH